MFLTSLCKKVLLVDSVLYRSGRLCSEQTCSALGTAKSDTVLARGTLWRTPASGQFSASDAAAVPLATSSYVAAKPAERIHAACHSQLNIEAQCGNLMPGARRGKHVNQCDNPMESRRRKAQRAPRMLLSGGETNLQVRCQCPRAARC